MFSLGMDSWNYVSLSQELSALQILTCISPSERIFSAFYVKGGVCKFCVGWSWKPEPTFVVMLSSELMSSKIQAFLLESLDSA
jgi:hypothetical protein